MEENVVGRWRVDREYKQLRGGHAESDTSTNQDEFDFVEPPTVDFFCPVTYELLLNPHQTTCCGNHLSEKAVDRLQREGKPCPMCKEGKFVTIPDKFFKRMTTAVLIRCPHKASGCEWVGEVGGSKQHINACPKRPWKCQYCDLKLTFEAGIQHIEECSKYLFPCPNKCVVPHTCTSASSASQSGTQICMIPRCDIEKHCAECPLEIVDCEFADVGCKVRTTRQELKRHMEESQQEHLFSATLLNLRLTRETIAEKDRQIVELQKQLAEKDRQIADKDSEMIQALVQLQQGVIEFTGGIFGFECHRISLENFSAWQMEGSHGDWHSDPFYSHSGEYRLQLNVETRERGTYMFVRLKSGDQITYGKTFVVALQMLNQQSNHNHYIRFFELLMKNTLKSDYSSSYNFVKFEELYGMNRDVQYLKDDCIKFVLWIKEKQ